MHQFPPPPPQRTRPYEPQGLTTSQLVVGAALVGSRRFRRGWGVFWFVIAWLGAAFCAPAFWQDTQEYPTVVIGGPLFCAGVFGLLIWAITALLSWMGRVVLEDVREDFIED
jgi:hypothetical protein